MIAKLAEQKGFHEICYQSGMITWKLFLFHNDTSKDKLFENVEIEELENAAKEYLMKLEDNK